MYEGEVKDRCRRKMKMEVKKEIEDKDFIGLKIGQRDA